MPCVDNFQALVSVQGMYLEEFLTRETVSPVEYDGRGEPVGGGPPGKVVDMLVESPFGRPYKIIFGAINPLLQETDWIVYVLIDGEFCGSRVLRRTAYVSSCQVRGMSLSHHGKGPLLLTEKDEQEVHRNVQLPAVPGSIRLLVYRGTASLTDEPSLFNYPTFVCPFRFVDNPDADRCSGLEHVTAFDPPWLVEPPDETYTFQSSDPTNAPWVTIDFYYRSDRQLSELLHQSYAVMPRTLRPPSPPPPAPLRAVPVVAPVQRPVASHLRVRELGGRRLRIRKDMQPTSGQAVPVYASSIRTHVMSDQSSPTSPSFPSPSYAAAQSVQLPHGGMTAPIVDQTAFFPIATASHVIPFNSGRPPTAQLQPPLVRSSNLVPAHRTLILHPPSAAAAAATSSRPGLIAPLPIRRSPFGARDTNIVVSQIEDRADEMGKGKAPPLSSRAPVAAAGSSWGTRPRRSVPTVKYEEDDDEDYVMRTVSPASNARARGMGGAGAAGPVAKKARRGDAATGRAAVGRGR